MILRAEEQRGLVGRAGEIGTKHPTRLEKEQLSNTICPTRQKQDYTRLIIDNPEAQIKQLLVMDDSSPDVWEITLNK